MTVSLHLVMRSTVKTCLQLCPVPRGDYSIHRGSVVFRLVLHQKLTDSLLLCCKKHNVTLVCIQFQAVRGIHPHAPLWREFYNIPNESVRDGNLCWACVMFHYASFHHSVATILDEESREFLCCQSVTLLAIKLPSALLAPLLSVIHSVSGC